MNNGNIKSFRSGSSCGSPCAQTTWVHSSANSSLQLGHGDLSSGSAVFLASLLMQFVLMSCFSISWMFDACFDHTVLFYSNSLLKGFYVITLLLPAPFSWSYLTLSAISRWCHLLQDSCRLMSTSCSGLRNPAARRMLILEQVTVHFRLVGSAIHKHTLGCLFPT
jgi:hypothetical protein